MELTNQDTSAAVERMKEYIDSHIRERITAKMLSDVAGYSQYHTARIFKQHTGQAPFEYIRERRLLDAALALRSGRTKVIDVALDFVFDSHEGFTRAFTKAFGIAPKRFASVPKPSGWIIPYRVSNRREKDMEGIRMNVKSSVIFTQIVERPARKLILKRSKSADNYFDYCEEFGCSEDGSGNPVPAETLSFIKEGLYEQVGAWLPDNMRPEGTGVYASALEVPADYSGKIPEGFDMIELEACKMLIFQGEPFKDEDYGEAIEALWDAIAKFNPIVYGYEYADELAPRMQLAPFGWRGYIEMRPVREMGRH